MRTVVDGEKRIVRVLIDTVPGEMPHHPDRWVQIEIIILRDDEDKSKIKRVRLKCKELGEIYDYVRRETNT